MHANWPQKIFMLRSKKISFKEFDNEKNSCGSKIPNPPPAPPHNFSNGPSLTRLSTDFEQCRKQPQIA